MGRRWLVLAVVILGALALPFPVVSTASAVPALEPVRLVVAVGPKVDPTAAAAGAARLTGGRVVHVYRHAFRGFALDTAKPAVQVLALLRRLGVTSLFQDVERTVRAGLDPLVEDFKVDLSAGQVVPPGIRRIGGDQSSTVAEDGQGDVDVDIAIVDSGIDAGHPDLNVAGGVDCTGGIRPALNGRPAWHDLHGHGTHVAGTAAARDNEIGVVGVAPGARLWAVKVFASELPGTDEDSEYVAGLPPPIGAVTLDVPTVPSLLARTSSMLCAFDWLAAHSDSIEVANMSLFYATGGDLPSCDGQRPQPGHVGSGLLAYLGLGSSSVDAEREAICAAVARGVTIAAATGNDGVSPPYEPARLDQVIGVSALADHDGLPGNLAPRQVTCPDSSMFYVLRDRYLPQAISDPIETLLYGSTDEEDEELALVAGDDTFARFSNHGPEVDLIAPGTCVLSTFLGGTFARSDGTSMAAPHVAGAAALYLSQHPGTSPAQVRQALVDMGAFDYDSSTDPDGIQEPRLDVSSL